MPASFDHIKTLFSTAVLNYFCLCNLELKALAYQFYQLICHMTWPLALASVANLYYELHCMSHLWRWIKKLKWAGYGYNNKDATNPEASELANFCPACPQPGINLEESWLANASNPVYWCTFVTNRNFKADPISQKEVNVWLYDDGGMAPKQQDYFDFLKTAMESSTSICCQCQCQCLISLRKRHVKTHSKQLLQLWLPQNLVTEQDLLRLPVQDTVATVQTQWQIFSLLFKGEQQKNVDFAFLQALKTTGVAVQQKVTLIYDIACQYSVHLQEQIGQHLPAGLIVDMAIGLFHVHAHKDECFFRFALTFIPGIGIVCSKILESLWLALNTVLSTVRTALLSHQAEMLNDHASDSNHKKLLGIALAISMSVGLAAQQWESAISEAGKQRLADISAMDIYLTKTCTDQADQPMPRSDRVLNPVENGWNMPLWWK